MQVTFLVTVSTSLSLAMQAFRTKCPLFREAVSRAVVVSFQTRPAPPDNTPTHALRRQQVYSEMEYADFERAASEAVSAEVRYLLRVLGRFGEPTGL